MRRITVGRRRKSLTVAKLVHFPDLLANLLELPETVRVASLGHGDRLLDDLDLPLLVVQVLVQLRLQVEVWPAQNARRVTEARNGGERGREMGDGGVLPLAIALCIVLRGR